MNNVRIFAVGLLLAAWIGAGCTKQAAEESQAAPAKDQSAVAQTDAKPVESSKSAEAYATMTAELDQLQKSATTREKTYEVITEVEKRFKGFIAEYPGTAEASDAKFQLGILYASLNKTTESIRYLKDCIASDSRLDEDKIGYAHFYIAEGYKAQDDYQNAKKHYKTVVDEYSHLHPQMVAAATTNLKDIETLKDLAVGGRPIPFQVKDLNGNDLSLERYRGKVVLLDFWATWCAPCRAEMPNVVNIHKRFNDKGFEIIGVSLDRDRKALEQYIRSNHMTWPQHFDGGGWNNAIAAKYKVRSIPMTYLIDRHGKIRYRSIRGKALENAVKKLLQET